MKHDDPDVDAADTPDETEAPDVDTPDEGDDKE